MATDNVAGIDYAMVLADLKAKRADLDAAIAGIERMLGAATGGVISFEGLPADVQPDSFFGMSIIEGTKKFLAMKKRPQTTQEIADALIAGGMTHASGNWGNTVGSVLNRSLELVRVKRGTWGLAAWYPGRRRTTSEKDKDGGSDGGSPAEPEVG